MEIRTGRNQARQTCFQFVNDARLGEIEQARTSVSAEGSLALRLPRRGVPVLFCSLVEDRQPGQACDPDLEAGCQSGDLSPTRACRRRLDDALLDRGGGGGSKKNKGKRVQSHRLQTTEMCKM